MIELLFPFLELTGKLEQTQPFLCYSAEKRFAILLSSDYTSKSHQKSDKNACTISIKMKETCEKGNFKSNEKSMKKLDLKCFSVFTMFGLLSLF